MARGVVQRRHPSAGPYGVREEGALGEVDEDAGHLVRGPAAPGVEQVEGVEARQDPEPVGGLPRREAVAEEAVPGQSPGEPHHALRPSLLAALHGAADGVRVERRHGDEGAEDVAVGGEGVHAAGDPVAQVHARVGIGHGVEDALEAAALEQVGGERVEEPGAGAEDHVDGRPRDAGGARDPVDADRLGGRLAQRVVDRVEDAPARLLGRLRAQTLLVAPCGHRHSVFA